MASPFPPKEQAPAQGQNQPPQQSPPPAPKPYQPTPEEEAYLQVCGQAIAAGSQAAIDATAAANASAFLDFANGVKSLTQAYAEIKTGGKAPTGHQGA